MRISCAACRNVDATGNRFILGRNRSRKPDGRHIALVQRLERHEHEAAIGCALAAGESDNVVHGRIVLDHVHQLLTELFMTGNEASCGPGLRRKRRRCPAAGKIP